MELVDTIKINRTAKSSLDTVDWNNLEFGRYISDHMFVCNYKDGDWQQPEITPFQDLRLSPSTLALHYGQSIFEGMKAFRMADGRINIFRIEKHYDRLNKSLRRMCMPPIPFDLFKQAVVQFMEVEQDWVPNDPGTAYYIRPFVFASEAKFGVKVSSEYMFLIFGGPVGPAFARPIKVKVEREFIRAAHGGTGFAKCAGNYGGAFYPTQLAREEGYDQLLWTDASEHEYIEESGMMNACFVINGTLVTPPLSDSILDGITRDSLLQVARTMGLPVSERRISINELIKAFQDKTITEAFGAGTAAIVAPISLISIDGFDYQLPEYNKKSLMFRVKDGLEAIRNGSQGEHEWNYIIS
jgi:branched-chain amino acid aminotransferase